MFLKKLFKIKGDKAEKELLNQYRAYGVNIFMQGGYYWVSLKDTQALINAYYQCPPLFNVINYIATYFSRMEFYEIQNVRGKVIKTKDTPFINSLNNPNATQGKLEFWQQWALFYLITGNTFTFNFSSLETAYNDPDKIKNLWNLPPQHTSFAGDILYPDWSMNDISEYIEKVMIGGVEDDDIKPENIIFTNDNNIKFNDNISSTWFLGQSKIPAIQKPISNIIANLKSENKIIEHRGALGILTNDARPNDMGRIPVLSDKEKQALQDEYRKYGINSDQDDIVISPHPMKWISMIQKIKDLQLIELLERDSKIVANTFGFPVSLMNIFDGGGFKENVSAFERQLITNVVIPLAEKMKWSFTKFFELTEKGRVLIVDYSHLPVMQKDAKVQAETAKIKSQVVIDINKAVKAGEMTIEAGRLTLMNSMPELSEDEAKKLIQPAEQQVNQNQVSTMPLAAN